MKYSPLALESLFKWKCIISLLYFCEVKKKRTGFVKSRLISLKRYMQIDILDEDVSTKGQENAPN